MNDDIHRPAGMGGMRHVALNVRDIAACEHFYVDLLGMQVEWRPDPDNLYLTSGCDNLALHVGDPGAGDQPQALDHIGFILRNPEAVDDWFAFLTGHGVKIAKPPRTHRDGARSFYCYDPEGNVVQIIYHPPIAAACAGE
ncbi:MAG: VOC family protein [Gammaproteobacteria bacterium]|jgi:catechol 2,3-dioxygenase-like lactoylglutathione lyase family enzyme